MLLVRNKTPTVRIIKYGLISIITIKLTYYEISFLFTRILYPFVNSY